MLVGFKELATKLLTNVSSVSLHGLVLLNSGFKNNLIEFFLFHIVKTKALYSLSGKVSFLKPEIAVCISFFKQGISLPEKSVKFSTIEINLLMQGVLVSKSLK